MTERMRIAAVVLFVGLASRSFAVGPGDVAPDFALTDVYGSTHSLHEARGKLVLVALIGHG